MANHPNRNKLKIESPSPLQIRELRKSLNLSQTDASKIIYCSLRGWQQWEAGERKMHPAFWELFKIKTLISK